MWNVLDVFYFLKFSVFFWSNFDCFIKLIFGITQFGNIMFFFVQLKSSNLEVLGFKEKKNRNKKNL